MSQPIDPNRVVIFSGAGISAESGLTTFRDGNGLWNQSKIEDVATPSAWEADPEIVLQFYNERRIQAAKAQPNAAHLAIAELEAKYEVIVITQNIDDLHERAGSSVVGTSLTVYPAASLLNRARFHAEKILVSLQIDKKPFGYNCWSEKATAVPSIVRRWLEGQHLGRLKY